MEYYTALRKKEILSFVTTYMKLEGIKLKWNKSDRERQILHDLTYMWNLKKAKLIKTESRVVVTRGWGKGDEKWGDVGQRVQTSSYKINGDCS